VTHTFHLDPCEILGIAATASLSEIRDAYRTKTKKYHPDVGGDAWAFRVLNRAYEIVSTARVAGRASEEHFRMSDRAGPSSPSSAPSAPAGDPVRARRGVHDTVDDPRKLVEVEMLLIRFEVESPMSLMVDAPEDRSLSCTVNVTWPAPGVPLPTPTLGVAEPTLMALAAAFEAVTSSTRVASARSSVEDGRFTGWLSYTTAARAEEGFRLLRAVLAERGLGVEQWIRDMAIPRTWRE
jgi:hypothetical protein